MATAAASGPAAATGYRYAIGLLTLIYVLNFVDRQLVTIVAEPIKREFALADWQVGAMTGLSFAILYTIAGFPLARLAERGDRARIIAGAVVVWSAFTALCGVAQNAVQLILARIGVGLGEAGCTPPAHSLITDIVPREKRASALAIYSMGAPLGGLLGMAMGGLIAAQWGWRSVFLVAAAPGLLLAALAWFTLAEPRRLLVRPLARTDTGDGFWPAVAKLLRCRSFMLVALGGATASFVYYGLAAFFASFYLRNHAAELAQIAGGMGMKPLGFLGVALGVSGGVAGVLGAIVGGRATDAWGRRSGAANVLMPALCTTLAAPLFFAAMVVDGLCWSIGLIAAASALNNAWVGGAYAAALGLVPAHARATASALMLFIMNLLGLGLGPLSVGLLSDMFAGSLGPGTGLRWGMACATLGGFVAAACFWAARTSLARDTVG